MRKSNGVFTSSERRGAAWLIAACLAVASLGIVADRLMGPSLGWYGGLDVAQTLDGVVEAQPLG